MPHTAQTSKSLAFLKLKMTESKIDVTKVYVRKLSSGSTPFHCRKLNGYLCKRLSSVPVRGSIARKDGVLQLSNDTAFCWIGDMSIIIETTVKHLKVMILYR